MDIERLGSAALGLVGAAMAIPVALAQIDFAGIVNVFGIDAGDTPQGVLVLAGTSGVGTSVLVLVAAAGALLVATDGALGARLLVVAALGGILTATIFWIGPGFALGLAAYLAQRDGRPEAPLADAPLAGRSA